MSPNFVLLDAALPDVARLADRRDAPFSVGLEKAAAGQPRRARASRPNRATHSDISAMVEPAPPQVFPKYP